MTSTNIPLPDTTGLTFEKVWAMFQETDRRMQETDKLFKELAKSQKQTEKLIGALGNRFGELAEHLVAPGIADRFNKLGYHFNSYAPGGIRIYDDKRQVLAEIDIMLDNAKTVAAVEVKSKPVLDDIEEHLDRIKVLRRHFEKNGNGKKVIIGAIAGAIFPENLKKAVIKAGLYVITQSGDTVKIDVPKGFKPREF